jgi:hypothetical protein
MKKIILVIVLLLSSIEADVLDKAGKYYVYYGYNKSVYSNSDIAFKGDGYDYTLLDVKATDRQSDFSLKYLTEITIPQFNFRIGYFIDDTQSISIGTDHMKYVVEVPQKVKINGRDHQGNTHTNGNIELDNFLAFEHTDGLNYINVAYNKFYPVWKNEIGTQAVSLFAGAGLGVLVPKSNVTLIGYKERSDEFKLAGYGVDVQGGMHYDFAENFFLRGELKTGYINMPGIATTNNSSDEASQDFTFFEYSISLGYQF